MFQHSISASPSQSPLRNLITVYCIGIRTDCILVLAMMAACPLSPKDTTWVVFLRYGIRQLSENKKKRFRDIGDPLRLGTALRSQCLPPSQLNDSWRIWYSRKDDKALTQDFQ